MSGGVGLFLGVVLYGLTIGCDVCLGFGGVAGNVAIVGVGFACCLVRGVLGGLVGFVGSVDVSFGLSSGASRSIDWGLSVCVSGCVFGGVLFPWGWFGGVMGGVVGWVGSALCWLLLSGSWWCG